MPSIAVRAEIKKFVSALTAIEGICGDAGGDTGGDAGGDAGGGAGGGAGGARIDDSAVEKIDSALYSYFNGPNRPVLAMYRVRSS
jgi:hypothetical protein